MLVEHRPDTSTLGTGMANRLLKIDGSSIRVQNYRSLSLGWLTRKKSGIFALRTLAKSCGVGYDARWFEGKAVHPI